MGVIEGALRTGLRVSPTAQIFIATTYQEVLDALTASVAENGDVILLPRGSTYDITATIVINKSGVRLLATEDGMSPLARGEFTGFVANASFTDGPVVTVNGPCELSGIAFASRDTGANFFSGAALLLGGAADANPFGAWVHGCRFPKWGLDNRIGIAVEGSSNCLIEESDFEGVGADFNSGIYVQGATQNIVIRKNHFRQCTAAVKFGAFAGGGPECIIDENIVYDGKMVDTDGNNGTGLFCRNVIGALAAGAAYDRDVSTLITAGWELSGNSYTES